MHKYVTLHPTLYNEFLKHICTSIFMPVIYFVRLCDLSELQVQSHKMKISSQTFENIALPVTITLIQTLVQSHF